MLPYNYPATDPALRLIEVLEQNGVNLTDHVKKLIEEKVNDVRIKDGQVNAPCF